MVSSSQGAPATVVTCAVLISTWRMTPGKRSLTSASEPSGLIATPCGQPKLAAVPIPSTTSASPLPASTVTAPAAPPLISTR